MVEIDSVKNDVKHYFNEDQTNLAKGGIVPLYSRLEFAISTPPKSPLALGVKDPHLSLDPTSVLPNDI